MRTKINIIAWGISCGWWLLSIIKLIMCHEYRGYMALILGACISALMGMYNYIALKGKNRTIYDQQNIQQNHKSFVALGMTKYMAQVRKPTKDQQNQQKSNKKGDSLLAGK